MSLAKGDHLRIQRDGKLVEPEAEAYHEFVVLGSLNHIDHKLMNYVTALSDIDAEGKPFSYYDVRIRVIR